jgi:predicted DNA-binding transcriptional regulator
MTVYDLLISKQGGMTLNKICSTLKITKQEAQDQLWAFQSEGLIKTRSVMVGPTVYYAVK